MWILCNDWFELQFILLIHPSSSFWIQMLILYMPLCRVSRKILLLDSVVASHILLHVGQGSHWIFYQLFLFLCRSLIIWAFNLLSFEPKLLINDSDVYHHILFFLFLVWQRECMMTLFSSQHQVSSVRILPSPPAFKILCLSFFEKIWNIWIWFFMIPLYFLWFIFTKACNTICVPSALELMKI